MAPAHLHATSVAVYPAVFFFSMNPDRQVELVKLAFERDQDMNSWKNCLSEFVNFLDRRHVWNSADCLQRKSKDGDIIQDHNDLSVTEIVSVLSLDCFWYIFKEYLKR